MIVKDEKISKASDKVQMAKGAEKGVLSPEQVESKKLEGFDVVGTVALDADGKVTEETAKVIETPAHVFLTSDGYLKVIPDNYNLVDPKV
jgi:hypothetical protein